MSVILIYISYHVPFVKFDILLFNKQVINKIWENPHNKHCADCGMKGLFRPYVLFVNKNLQVTIIFLHFMTMLYSFCQTILKFNRVVFKVCALHKQYDINKDKYTNKEKKLTRVLNLAFNGYIHDISIGNYTVREELMKNRTRVWRNNS